MKRLLTMATIGVLTALPALAHAQVSLPNPLGTTDPRIIIANLIRGALSVAGPVALLMFIYGGVLWMTSTGNTDRIQKGKKVLVWATLGIVVILSAFIITNALFNAILHQNVAGPAA